MHRRQILSVLALSVLAGCTQTFEAGPAGTSADGQSYFVVYDGPSKACKSPMFDGAPWTGGFGHPVPVTVGPHRFECNGTVVTLNMPKGMIYKVDYRQL